MRLPFVFENALTPGHRGRAANCLRNPCCRPVFAWEKAVGRRNDRQGASCSESDSNTSSRVSLFILNGKSREREGTGRCSREGDAD